MAGTANLANVSIEKKRKGGAQRRLRTVGNARKLVADTLRGMESGWDGSDPWVGKAIIEGAKTLAALIQASESEDKLRRLELASARTLPASPVLERPQPAPRREYTAPDRSKRGEDASARPEPSVALDTPDKP